jgi:sulfite reductase (NADPH) flavoprotein alpha-component
MLPEHKLKILLDLINSSSKDELAWMNAYISDLTNKDNDIQPVTALKPAVNKITIAYGTETGNSKRVATDFAARASMQKSSAWINTGSTIYPKKNIF